MNSRQPALNRDQPTGAGRRVSAAPGRRLYGAAVLLGALAVGLVAQNATGQPVPGDASIRLMLKGSMCRFTFRTTAGAATWPMLSWP